MRDYIVFDLEWNQSPDGKEKSINRLPFEIIEIGAVKLDEQFQKKSEFHKLIAPRVYKQMHYKISEVTRMSMEELQEQGEKFEDAAAEFIQWCGTDFIFCTWGSMDITELQRNMSYYEMRLSFPKPLFYYDIQKLYTLLRGDTKEKPSLDTAAEELGVIEARPFHRALDDAYYTGKVLASMDFKSVQPYLSVDYYRLPGNREEELYLEFPRYSKYVSRVFQTKEAALEDKTVTDILCPSCKRMLRKKIHWFSFNQKVYFSLGICPVHGHVQGKIRMKKTDSGSVYVVKVLKHIDEERAESIFQRKDELKMRRNQKNKSKKIVNKSVSQDG